MDLIIYRRTTILWNSLLFIPASILWLASIVSLNDGKSVFDLSNTLLFFEKFWPYVLISLVLFRSVFKVQKSSLIIFIVFVTCLFFRAFLFYFVSYDKIILLTCFIYLALSFQVIVFYATEKASALYYPGFSNRLLNVISAYKIPIEITSTKLEGHLTGFLTNWSGQSFFVLLDAPANHLYRMKISFEIHYDGHTFKGEGMVCTSYGDGVGILVQQKEQAAYFKGWKSLYRIINDKGLTPDYNRT